MTEETGNIEQVKDVTDADEQGVQRSLRLSIWEGASYSVMVGIRVDTERGSVTEPRSRGSHMRCSEATWLSA